MKSGKELLQGIFTRYDITPEAVDEYAKSWRDNDVFKIEVWAEFAHHLYNLLLAHKPAASIKSSISPAIRRLAWHMAGDMYSPNCNGIGDFVRAFPEMAERLWTVGIQHPVSGEFITALKTHITPDNITKLNPLDMHALNQLLSVCDSVGDWYYDVAADALNKGYVQYTPLLGIFNRISWDKFNWTMDLLLKTKPKAYRKHIYATAMESNKASHEIIKKMKGYKARPVRLTVPYSIPRSVSGEDLCNLLKLLEDRFILDDNFKDLLTETELKERALEVQLKGKSGLLNDAINARDRLESIIQHGTTVMSVLFHSLIALAQNAPGVADKEIIRHTVTTKERDAIEAAPALLRLLNMAADNKLTSIEANNRYLWGEKLTEKRARKLLQVLQEVFPEEKFAQA